MSVSFIYGRAGSGKSEYILNCIKKIVCETGEDNKKKVYLIVPEQYTHIAERKVLGKVDSLSPLSAEVLSFERLCSRIIKISEDVIDSAAKSIIISDIINKADLSVFKKMKLQKGFAQKCSDFISELKKYNISPQKLKDEIDSMEPSVLKNKLSDIYEIYVKYEEQSPKIDSEDMLSILSDNIEKSGFFENSVVFFDEFSSFIPKEINVLSKIANLCDKMYISLCTDEIGNDGNMSVFTTVKQTAQRIIKSFGENNVEIGKSVFINGNFKYNSELSHLEKTLYSGNKKANCNGKIKIFYDINPYYEIKNTASKIVSLIRDEGYKCSQIGVVCADINEYSKTIKQVFSEYNISCFVDKKSEVINHPIVRFVLGAIDIFLEGYSAGSVFSYLNLGFSDLSDYQISILENYVLATDIKKNAYLNDDAWNYKLKKYSGKSKLSGLRLNEIHMARKMFVESIEDFHKNISKKEKLEDFVKYLYEFLLKNEFDKKIEQYAQRFKALDMVQNAKEFLSVWDIVVNTLDMLIDTIGGEIVSAEEFKNFLCIALSEYNTGMLPTSSDEVMIGNVDRSIQSDLKVLFVLGMSDTAFPAKISEDVLFGNLEREKLSEDGIELSDTAINKLYYNRFLTYRCLSAPSERLYLSFSVSSSDNKPLRPSFVLNTVKRLYNDLDIESRIEENISDGEKISAYLPAKEYLVKNMYDGNFTAFWKDVATYFSKNDDYDTIVKYFTYTPDAQSISEATADAFFDDKNDISISKIQRYRECKYSYFMQYMLKLSEREVFSIEPADIGSLVHSVFEKICRRISEDKKDFSKIPKQYYSDKIDEYINEFIENLKMINTKLSKRSIYLIKRLKNTMKLCFEVLIDHIVNSSFEPMGYEMYFGGDDIGSIDIKTKNGKVFSIKGIIDRADKFEDENGTYVRIIDYKTGKKTFNFSDVFYGLDVQLLVYLKALVNSNENYKYGGALYFKIDDCIFDGDNKYAKNLTDSKIKSTLKLRGLIPSDENVFDAYDENTKKRANTATYDQIENLLSKVFKTVTELCDSMVSGDIEIKPYKKSNKTPCSYCPYKNVCKFELGSACYDNITSLKKEEIFEMISEGGGKDVDKLSEQSN